MAFEPLSNHQNVIRPPPSPPKFLSPFLPFFLYLSLPASPCISVSPGGLSVFQVLLDVLHVRELGLCSTDAAEDAQLEAPLSILPLVGAMCPLPAPKNHLLISIPIPTSPSPSPPGLRVPNSSFGSPASIRQFWRRFLYSHK